MKCLNTKEETMGRKGAPDAPGMRGNRSRTKAGPLREKRGDTLNKTIEKQYDIDTGMRDDAHLDTVLKRHNVNSLHDLVKKLQK
jgi:hypothetical protein